LASRLVFRSGHVFFKTVTLSFRAQREIFIPWSGVIVSFKISPHFVRRNDKGGVGGCEWGVAKVASAFVVVTVSFRAQREIFIPWSEVIVSFKISPHFVRRNDMGRRGGGAERFLLTLFVEMTGNIGVEMTRGFRWGRAWRGECCLSRSSRWKRVVVPGTARLYGTRTLSRWSNGVSGGSRVKEGQGGGRCPSNGSVSRGPRVPWVGRGGGSCPSNGEARRGGWV